MELEIQIFIMVSLLVHSSHILSSSKIVQQIANAKLFR